MNLNLFKSLDINQLSKEELQDIAYSLGISKSSTKYCKNSEIYIKIQNVLLSHEKIEEEEQINSFNKNRPLLEVKDNLDPCELLFWNVFRTKTIFKKIFSNFNSKIFSYYQLVDITEILNKFSNGKAIIKDKLISGADDLVLTNRNSYIYTTFNPLKKDSFEIPRPSKHSEQNKFELIYKLFKSDTSENEKLFNKLFNNYSIYFDNSRQSIEYQLPLILHSYSLAAMKQFIQFYSTNQENLQFIRSKIYYYISFANSYYKTPITNILTSYQDLKKFNFLKTINNNHLQFVNNKNQIIDNHDKSNINPITINVNCFNIIKSYTSTTVKQLNKMFLIMVNNNLNNINNNDKNSILIKEIKQIINNHLNSSGLLNHTLKSASSIVYNSNGEKLYKFYIKIIELIKSISTPQDQKLLNELIEVFNFLEKEKEDEANYIQEKLDSRYKDINSLIRYLKKFTNNLQATFNNRSRSYKFKMTIFKWIRRNGGDNDCVKSIHELFEKMDKDKLKLILKEYLNEFLLEIKSKEELDYYFTNYKDIFYDYNNSNWKFIKSIQLLDHYENQMKSLDRLMVINNFKDQNCSDHYVSEHYVFNFFLEKPLGRILRACFDPSVYKFQIGFKLSSYHHFISDYFDLGKKEIIIELFKKLEIKVYHFPNLTHKRPYYYLNSCFIKWIIENYSGDIWRDSAYKLRIDLSSLSFSSTPASIDFEFQTTDFIQIFYFNKLYEKIIFNQNRFHRIFTPFMNIIVFNNNLSFKFVDDLIQIYNQQNFGSSELKNLIVGFFTYASIYGSLAVFKMLFSKYRSELFKSKYPCFQVTDLKEWLKYSIQCGHIQLAEFLSNYCKLTENEFTKFIHPNNHSIGYNYFKDKFIMKYEEE